MPEKPSTQSPYSCAADRQPFWKHTCQCFSQFWGRMRTCRGLPSRVWRICRRLPASFHCCSSFSACSCSGTCSSNVPNLPSEGLLQGARHAEHAPFRPHPAHGHAVSAHKHMLVQNPTVRWKMRCLPAGHSGEECSISRAASTAPSGCVVATSKHLQHQYLDQCCAILLLSPSSCVTAMEMQILFVEKW